MDPSGLVVVRDLGKDTQRFSLNQPSTVTWDDIGGLVDAKQQMLEAVELPWKHPDLYAHYGKKPLRGVLLYGPPGCGKTMLGAAAASSLARTHGKDQIESGYLYVKGPEILDPFVGVTEATIRELFERGRAHEKAHGYPATLFIDEADAILGKRGGNGPNSSIIDHTVVAQFLSEMDGLDKNGTIVILATNRADILDPAVTRRWTH